jgi:hypothetical protein
MQFVEAGFTIHILSFDSTKFHESESTRTPVSKLSTSTSSFIISSTILSTLSIISVSQVKSFQSVVESILLPHHDKNTNPNNIDRVRINFFVLII